MTHRSAAKMTVTMTGLICLTFSASAALADPAPECQKALEAAVLKLTTSGPLRAIEKRMRKGTPETVSATEFVPPDSIQKRISDDGSDVASKAPEFTMMGANVYYGLEKTIDDQKIEGPIFEYGPLADFADPFRYYAAACNGTVITFAYEVSGGNDPDLKVRQDLIAKKKAKDASYGGPPQKDPVGTMTLDAIGRPAAIRYDTTGTTGWPDAWSIAFSYDPALKIAAPK